MSRTVVVKQLKPWISKARIQRRVQALGKQIQRDYRGKSLVCICVLKGAVPFFTDLIRAIDLPMQIDFIRVASYFGGKQSTGKVKKLLDVSLALRGCDLLLIEDIVDTGLTMHYLLNDLKRHRPASIRIASLLLKPAMLQKPVAIDYLGFLITNEFVVGYGLDYQEQYRNLPYITRLLQTND